MPGQGNNVYIFPAIGMAVFATEATRVTDEMFIVAAQAVAEKVTEKNLSAGLIYPPQSHILTHRSMSPNESQPAFSTEGWRACRGRPMSAR